MIDYSIDITKLGKINPFSQDISEELLKIYQIAHPRLIPEDKEKIK